MELTHIGAILAKAESTLGTDPTPTGAANNIAIVRGTIPTEPQGTVVDRDILDAGFDIIPGLLAKPNQTIKIRCELRGNFTTGASNTDISSGKVTNLIEIDCLLQACDLIPTYTAQTSEPNSRDGYVIYKPALPTVGTVGPTVYFYVYSQKKIYKVAAAKGNIDAITMGAGQFAYIDFTFQGKYIAVADSSIPALTFLATKPPLFYSATATHTLTIAPFQTAVLKLGNTLVMREDAQDASASTGIHSFIVGNRNSTFDIDPESSSEATAAFWAAWAARTNHTLTLTYGSQSGNKFSLITTMNVDSIKYGDRNKNRIMNITSSLRNPTLGTAYGSDLQLKFF